MKTIWKILLGLVAALALMSIIGKLVATPETDAAHAAKDAVVAQMRDGNSAQFRSVKVYRPSPNVLAVCGEVDGANAFGGLAGFKRFFVLGGAPVIIEDVGLTAAYEDLWHAAGCDGVPVTVIPD